jgi:hypothetical protein
MGEGTEKIALLEHWSKKKITIMSPLHDAASYK